MLGFPAEPAADAVSILVPAHQAESTLAATLDSVVAQTVPSWEVVVVDDGSTDGTRRIVAEYCHRDPRFRYVSEEHHGAAAARNTALAEARSDLTLFLDADDLLLPTMLERMTGALAAHPSAGAAYCGWARLAADGSVVHHAFFRDSGDLFPVLAGVQPFVVHACLVRTHIARTVGDWDTTLRAGEDWDFWQRAARGGCEFVAVPEELVLYRMRPRSASQDPLAMLQDGLRVLEQGHSVDPRVTRPVPAWQSGLRERDLRPHRYRLAGWSAGLMLGQGRSPDGLIERIGHSPCPDLAPHVIADALAQAILLPTAARPDAWRDLWPSVCTSIERFLENAEIHSGAPDLATGARRRLEALVADLVPDRPLVIGRTRVVAVELRGEPHLEAEGEPPAPRPAPDLLRCHVSWGGVGLGLLELPVFEGGVEQATLADLVVEQLAWPLLRLVLRERVGPSLRVERSEAGNAVWRGEVLIADNLPEGDDAALKTAACERGGWLLFLQELWNRPEWPLARFYDPDAAEPAETMTVCAGSTFVFEVSAPLVNIASTADQVPVLVRVGGRAIGEVEVPVAHGCASASRLRAHITTEAGLELARATLRECVCFVPDDGSSLHERLDRASLRPLPIPRGTVFGRRLRGEPDSAISRHARLPRAALPDLARAARTASEPMLDFCSGAGPSPAVTVDPSLVIAPRAQLETGRSPHDPVAAPKHSTPLLPILMYHRIADAGDPSTARYRTSPRAFEEQLAVLRALGFHTVTVHAWREAMKAHAPLPGRALVLTFDDGTRDFATDAWPLLQRYGFSASLFVSSEAAQQEVYSDRLHGEVIPALTWDELRRLASEGVEIGSHGATHRHLTRLAPAVMVRELAASRADLQDALGRPIYTLAYPFGDEDGLVRHLAAACGYVYGLTVRPARASLWDTLLALPRIEVEGGLSIAELAHRLGVGGAA